MGKLTIPEVEAITEGQWLSDGPALSDRTGGSLVFRRKGGVIHAYLRYAIGRTSKVYRIGHYDRRGQRGVSLAMARDEASRLAKLRREGATDLGEYFATQEAERLAAIEARRRAEEQTRIEAEAAARALAKAEEARQRYTLEKLAQAYLDHLEETASKTAALGLPTAKGQRRTLIQVRSLFKCHLFPLAELCAKPAREITGAEAASVIRACTQAGHGRAPGQLRSYLRSAYALAFQAPLSGEITPAFLGFEVDGNPFAALPSRSVNARHRTLTDEDLANYLRPLFGGDITDLALLLHVLSAGQRLQQLLRLTLADWDPQNATLRLWDGKGRRSRPREHLVPMGPVGAALVRYLATQARQTASPDTPAENIYLFSSRAGTALSAETAIKRGSQRAGITPGDIRRTVETRLASLGVSQDHRAQLLSHGLSGVQMQHYDRHHYGQEKRAAIELLEEHLEAVLVRE